MSQENLDVIRKWLEAWNSTDLDTFAGLFDGDAEVMTDPLWMEAGPFIGRAAVMSWYDGLKESWEGHDEIVLRELFEAGDKVIARLDWRVRGRASGIETNLDATSVNNIDQGKIVRQHWYFDHAQALKAVGLEE